MAPAAGTTPNGFTQRVLVARALLGAGALAVLAVSPRIPGREIEAVFAVLAIVTSIAAWPFLERSWRAVGVFLVVYDGLTIAAMHALTGTPELLIAFSWPMIVAAFIVGPRFAVVTGLGAATLNAGSNLIVRGHPSVDAIVSPFILLSGIGYVLGRFASLQQRTAQSLGELEARHHDIVRSAPDALVILDRRFVATEWNPAAEALFGLDEDGRLGSRLAIDWNAPSGPFRRARDVCEASGRFEPETMDLTFRDDTPVSVSVSMASLRDPSRGEVTGYVAACRDVTAARRHYLNFQRLAQVTTDLAALTEPEEVTNRFLEATRELTNAEAAGFVEVADDHCEIVAAAGLPDWLVGYRYPPSKGVAAAVAREHHAMVINDYQRSDSAHPLFRELGFQAMMDVPLPDSAPIRATLVSARHRSGAPFTRSDVELLEALAGHAAVALQRATTLGTERRVREDLQRLNQMKDEFLTTASHELRTPLTALTGFLQTLSKHFDELDPPMRAQMLDRAYTQAQRLQRLIERLLDISRVAGGYTPRMRAVDLQVVVEVALATVPTGKYFVDVPSLTVIADPDDLTGAVVNLLENAVKYGGGSPIRISAVASGSRALVSVSDEGPGIPEDEREQLFDRFYRGSQSGRAPGLGVGLAIVREHLERMEGSVWYEPNEPRGSRFVISLRLAPSTLDAPSDVGTGA